MFQQALNEPFKAEFKSFPVSKMPGQDHQELEKGGKIILPAYVQRRVGQRDPQYSMLFKLSNRKESCQTHCGVLAFVAEEGRVYLPYWMMNNLLLEEGSIVHVENVALSVATFAKFQPQSPDFLDITSPKAVIENALRAFDCLTMGDIIPISHNEKIFQLHVIETLPENCVAITKDVAVEFAMPVGDVGSTRPLAGQQNTTAHCDEEEEEYEYEYEYEEEYEGDYIDEEEGEREPNEKLLEDIRKLKRFCKEVEIYERPGLDEVEILFQLPASSLQEYVMQAWRLPQMPIYIALFLSYADYYEKSSSARMEVFQDTNDRSCTGVLVQFQRIMKTYLTKAMDEAQKDIKRKTGKKTLPKQPMNPPRVPKLPRLVASYSDLQSPKLNTPRVSPSDTHQPDPKYPLDLGRGLLVKVFDYAQHRIRTLNAFCVICDEPHQSANAALLKPSPCDAYLCLFSYSKFTEDAVNKCLGKLTKTDDLLYEGSEVVDLLIAMAKAACTSDRWESVFSPYAVVIDPNDDQAFVFCEENKKTSVLQVRQVLAKVMSLQAMIQFSGSVLKQTMDATDRLIFPLLQWVISSNRSLVVSLKPQQRLSFMKTLHQFMLRTSPPAREAAFNQAKETYGSVFAFHGSSIENWHSILRRGLINASGTSLQQNGAAYGKGIYLSPDASVSFSYSSSNTSAPASSPPLGASEGEVCLHLLPPQTVACVALCEIANSKDLKRVASDIWVLEKEEYVVTRFLFVFENGVKREGPIRSDDRTNSHEIRKALM